MSFAKALQEISALERRVEELTRASKGKDLELARLQQGQSEQLNPREIDAVVQALKDSETTKLLEVLIPFVDRHQSVETGMNVLKTFGKDKHQSLVEAITNRLQKLDDNEAVTTEILRLTRGLLREARASCQPICDQVVPFFLARIHRDQPSGVREASARCAHTILTQNATVRDAIIADEKHIDQMTLILEEMAALVRNPESSCNGECARLFVTVKALFVGNQGEGDKLVARMLIRSGFVSATVERMSLSFMEAVDIKEKKLRDVHGPLLSTTQEGLGRGSVLLDGFRFLYIVAIFADEDMLQALLENDNKPTLSGEDLEKCDLSNPALGLGDRYVFLQTHVTLVTTGSGTVTKDIDNLDMIKISVCSLLMFANKAPGFVAYLFRRGVGPCLYELLDRETTRAKMPGGQEDDLLSILIAIKTLVDDNEDFKEQFQDLFFSRLQPELNPSDYGTEEEFSKAREQRHFRGRSIPDTTFGKVVALLTSFHDHVKRYAGELLFFLCDEDANKMNALVGFGHSAHILAIKGGMLSQMGGGQ